MCGRYYIDSDMADEIEKVVHDIDQRIRQEHFAGDIFPTNVAPIIEKSEHGLKLDVCKWGYPLSQGKKANEKAFTNQKKVLAKRGVACPIFFCPTCGRRLGFTSRETGYRCMQAHISGLSGCAESKMDRKEAEETVLDAARNMAQFISENLEKKKREWHKTILKEENIATLKSEKKRLSSRKMKLYSDYRSEVLDKEGYMEELEKTTSRISEITLQIAELENEIAVAKKKCDEATEKEMEVNEIAALQDFDKIQLSKIIEKVFIYEPGRMEISWKMDDIFYKEEKA